MDGKWNVEQRREKRKKQTHTHSLAQQRHTEKINMEFITIKFIIVYMEKIQYKMIVLHWEHGNWSNFYETNCRQIGEAKNNNYKNTRSRTEQAKKFPPFS